MVNVMAVRSWVMRGLALCAVATYGLFANATPADVTPESPKGTLVMIGGALRNDNVAVWQRIVQLAGGKDASIAVFGSASVNPQGSGQTTIAALNRAGAKAFFVPLAVKLPDQDYRKVASDPHWVTKVQAAGGVYLVGGDQGRITQVMRHPDGKPTPMLDAIWQVYRGGGVIAGTSAGAAIMSTTMFHDAMPVLATLKNGVERPGVMAPGLGFIGPDIFVDQHLIVRGRFARMLPAMVTHGYKLGVGVDENTAAIVTPDKQLEVLGYKGVLVVDLSDAKLATALPPLDIRAVKLSYLGRGDHYDLTRKVLVIKPEKGQKPIDLQKGSTQPSRFYPDILGNTTVVDLMQTLAGSGPKDVVGLAFSQAPDSQPELGFEFRFRKGPDSLAYDTGTLGGEDITVLNIHLDIRPVEMAVPLYRPRAAP